MSVMVSEFDETFEDEVTASTLPVVLFFCAPWCNPSAEVGLILHELAHDYRGVIKFVKIDIDQCPRIPTQFRIRAIPLVVFIYSGSKFSEQILGVVPKAEIVSTLDRIVDSIAGNLR